MIEPMLRAIDSYLLNLEENNEVDLFVWMRRMVTMCSTSAVYGPSNPFTKDPSFYDLFW